MTGSATVIDFSRIRQHELKKYLQKHALLCTHSLSRIQCTNYDQSLGESYYKHTKSYVIKANIDTVWNTYKTIRPEETWKGNMVSFGFMYCRNSNKISFSDDSYYGLAAGQLLFLHLNIIPNVLRLAVGHEVIAVNEQEKSFQTCYLEQGASAGSQHIQLHPLSNGDTVVEHVTRYRSGSSFRDIALYPALHTRAITEFHTNVKVKAEMKK